MKTPTFADQAPPGLGSFSSTAETLRDVSENGWRSENLRPECGYIKKRGIHPKKPSRESQDLEKVRLRRRPCDGFSLQSPALQNFEKKYPSFFPHPYQIDRQWKLDDGLPPILDMARGEFHALDYLQPLSGVIQAARSDLVTPFITRCWDFSETGNDDDGPGALIKKARLKVDNIEPMVTGACICYEPPTQDLLEEDPNNFFIFRSIVGHEIGHYWWDTLSDENRPPELQHIHEVDPSESREIVEQVAGLFSIFVIMYRGYWARQPLTADLIGEAWQKLGFESQKAAKLEKKIMNELCQIPTLPVFVPQAPESLGLGQNGSPDGQLSSDMVSAIRNAARKLVEKSTNIPFASVASIIGQRKLDTLVTFKSVGSDQYPSWSSQNRRAVHQDADVTSLWKEIAVTVPDAGAEPLPLAHRLEIARHLAHIRLHSDWAVSPTHLQKAADIERECSEESRDLARVLALAIQVMHGETSRFALDFDLARLLLECDPAGLHYLSDYVETDFQWCCQDPDRPDAEARFLAEIRGIGFGEVHCTFWGEDGKELRISLPLDEFRNANFQDDDLQPGAYLKLFGISTDGSQRLIPSPLKASSESPPSIDERWRQESGITAAEPVAV